MSDTIKDWSVENINGQLMMFMNGVWHLCEKENNSNVHPEEGDLMIKLSNKETYILQDGNWIMI